jgi:hypothetical protein
MAAVPAAAFTGGTGGVSTGGTGGRGGNGGTGAITGCRCELSGTSHASNLGGVFGSAAIGACLWRISRRKQQ